MKNLTVSHNFIPFNYIIINHIRRVIIVSGCYFLSDASGREHLAPYPLRLIRVIIITDRLASDRASCEYLSAGWQFTS